MLFHDFRKWQQHTKPSSNFSAGHARLFTITIKQTLITKLNHFLIKYFFLVRDESSISGKLSKKAFTQNIKSNTQTFDCSIIENVLVLQDCSNNSETVSNNSYLCIQFLLSRYNMPAATSKENLTSCLSFSSSFLFLRKDRKSPPGETRWTVTRVYVIFVRLDSTRSFCPSFLREDKGNTEAAHPGKQTPSLF